MRTIMLLMIAGLVSLTGCFKETPCVRGEGPVTEVKLDIDEFTSVDLQGSMNVHITYGEKLEVIAEGEANIIDELETHVANGNWVINLGQGCFYDFDLTIHITLPILTMVKISGSGNITVNDQVASEVFHAESGGSGKIFLGSLSGVSELNARITGSGPIEVTESWTDLDYVTVDISGSGTFRGYRASAPKVEVKSSGSGDCEVTAVDLLNVIIRGSGDVYYKGHPEISIDDNGSGSLISRN